MNVPVTLRRPGRSQSSRPIDGVASCGGMGPKRAILGPMATQLLSQAGRIGALAGLVLAALTGCGTGPYKHYEIEAETRSTVTLDGRQPVWHSVHVVHTTPFPLVDSLEPPPDWAELRDAGWVTLAIDAARDAGDGPLEVELIYWGECPMPAGFGNAPALPRQGGDADLDEDGAAELTHPILFTGAETGSNGGPPPNCTTGDGEAGDLVAGFRLESPTGDPWTVDVVTRVRFERDYPSKYYKQGEEGLTVALEPSSAEALGWVTP